ncbi:MAG: trigger factor [bacterium]|nr:trigger factor [bacterium]
MSETESHAHSATNVKITRDTENWEVEVKAEIPADAYLRYHGETLKEMQKTAKLDGFRPGHAPEEAIIRVYGESAVARHAVEHAIQHELPIILAKENLPVVETPRVTIETPVAGKPVSFTARAALAPEIKLPDYKEIAKKHTDVKEDATVSDKEHTDVLSHLRRERARIEKVETGTEPAKAAEESRKMEEKDLPALDDAFTQSLGYENSAHFETKIRENMKAEKERRIIEKRRQSILEEMVKESKISYPAILREYELDDMEAQFKEDLSRAGTTLEAYLTESKKTREQLRADWKGSADKRAKTRLILSEIARKENINPDEKTLAQEIEHARKHYKDADPEALRSHIAHAMRNDAVLQFLEKHESKDN